MRAWCLADGLGAHVARSRTAQNASVIWLDQPAGSGFSFADHEQDYATNEDEVSQYVYTFLLNFFAQYPQYQHLDFYVTGESYGGHFVPAVASRIVRGNNGEEGVHINLKAIAVGNGYVSASEWEVASERGWMDEWMPARDRER